MIEIERKYEVEPDFVVPPLDRPGRSAADAPPVALTATYYDTPDLRLARARTTLRRRTGGADAGWHLKVPLGGEREEIQLPLGTARTVPSALSQLVLAHTRGARLLAVARLQTTRTTRTVSAADGTPLVEVADDHVRAQRLGPGAGAEVVQWREVEAELLAGAPPEALAAVVELLTEAGARPARSSSKLAQVLGDAVPAGPEVPEPRTAIGPREPAGEAVTAYLRLQVRTLMALDPSLRRGSEGAAAALAQAATRLTSVLRVFGGLLDPGSVAAVRPGLGWLDGLLSVAHIRQVACDRLREELDALPRELLLGTRPPDLAGATTDPVGRALRSRRYVALLDRLVALATAPPLTSLAETRARHVLPALVRQHWDRLDRRVSRALAAPTDRELRRCAEAAGWLQAAAQAAVPIFGEDAAALADRAAAIGAVLARHESSAAARAVLLRVARAQPQGFACGVLYAAEADRARRALDDLAEGWQQARRKRYRRWLG